VRLQNKHETADVAQLALPLRPVVNSAPPCVGVIKQWKCPNWQTLCCLRKMEESRISGAINQGEGQPQTAA